MNDWMKNTTYTPSEGLGSFMKRNVADNTFQGLSPRGQGVAGAFGAAMTGAGNQMMGKPQTFAAPRMDAMPEFDSSMPASGGGAFAPASPPQAPGKPQARNFAGNGFLEYLRGR